jgi:hypothetical protein
VGHSADRPIEVHGQTITTLADARAYLVGLPNEWQGRLAFQNAAARLLEAADDPTPERIAVATAAFSTALALTMMDWRKPGEL